MLTMKMGRCKDMTNLAIAAMRANGIPVTSDYTPYWANSGNNHAWNAVLADGRAIPFMGCGADPGNYHLWGKLAKVYRKMYAYQPENLAFKLKSWEKAPGWLSGKSYRDVTREYVPVSDVTITLDSIPDSTRFAYLCVFNSGDWGAIHWGEIRNRQVSFHDMGRDIVYLPAFYRHKELQPAGPPFILTTEGEILPLQGSDTAATQQIELISTTKRELKQATDGVVETYFTPAAEYELFLWNNGWESLGKTRAQGDPLRFSVPAGKLYWLVETGGRRQERIFTWENGRQIWW
jgi:hypothetical protein